MKNIITILLLATTFLVSAQETKTSNDNITFTTFSVSNPFSTPHLEKIPEVKDNSVDVYVAPSLSVSNTGGEKFDSTSYASVEVGVCKDNLALGLVIGRGNLNFKSKDQLENYWYEAKTSVYKELGNNINVFLLLGLGNYVNTNRLFIEYGGGLAYKPKKLTYLVQVSNWDGVVYVSPGVSFNL